MGGCDAGVYGVRIQSACVVKNVFKCGKMLVMDQFADADEARLNHALKTIFEGHEFGALKDLIEVQYIANERRRVQLRKNIDDKIKRELNIIENRTLQYITER